MAFGLQAFALAIWFGGGLAVLYGTRGIFRVAGSRQEAGIFAGAVLRNFRWLQIAAVAMWFAAPFFGTLGRTRFCSTLAALFTVLSWPVDARLHRMRDLDPADPLRKRWGVLHGISVLLLIGQVLAAGAGLILLGR